MFRFAALLATPVPCPYIGGNRMVASLTSHFFLSLLLPVSHSDTELLL